MSDSHSLPEIDLLIGRLVDDFCARVDRGESPDPDEYTQRYPQHSNLIRDVLMTIRAVHVGAREKIGDGSSWFGLTQSQLDETHDPWVNDGASALFTPFVGRILSDRFEVRSRLGQGSMGVVYLAHDRKWGEDVAIKLIRRASPSTIYRFKQEFRQFSKLQHPHLVSLYEMFEDAGTWYFTMEYFDAGSFFQRLRSETDAGDEARDELGGYSRAEVLPRLLEGFRQLCEGIQALHDAGLIHRDIKPSNILVDRTGRVALSDFGLGITVQSDWLTENPGHYRVGSIGYMSPEQATGRNLTPASDWYSFGVVLYEGLTRERPIKGTPQGVLAAKIAGRRVSLTWAENVIPSDLRELCERLLNVDESRRPSGIEIAAILERYTGTVPPARGNRHQRATERRFVGRSEELSALERLYSHAQFSGNTSVVQVTGVSGVGKTALIRQFLAGRPTSDRRLILSSRCYEDELVPYKALDPLIDQVVSYLRSIAASDLEQLIPDDFAPLTTLFPVFGRLKLVGNQHFPKAPQTVDLNQLRRRAIRALGRLFRALAARHGLAVWIDDMQWSDADSRNALSDLIQQDSFPGTLIVFSSRERSPALEPDAALRTPARAWHAFAWMPLSGLNDEDALRILNQRAEQIAIPSIQQSVLRLSAGNPYWLHTLLDELGDHTPSIACDHILEELLWNRVARLSRIHQELLEVLCVSGSPLPASVVAGAAGLTQGVRSAISVLKAQRLIESGDDDGLRPFHDRVREMVLARMSSADISQRHRCLALALERHGTEVHFQELARHFAEGGELDRAADYYWKAAEQSVTMLAFELAVELYQRALDLGQSAALERAEILRGMGDALTCCGRCKDAVDTYRRALELAGSRNEDELRRKVAENLFLTGRHAEGMAELRPILRRSGLTIPNSRFGAIARMLWHRGLLRFQGRRYVLADGLDVSRDSLSKLDCCWTAALSLATGDPLYSMSFYALHQRLALRTGHPRHLAWAFAAEALVQAVQGSSGEAPLQTAFEIAETSNEPDTRTLVEMYRFGVSHFRGDWGQAIDEIKHVERRFHESPSYLVYMKSYLNMYLMTCLFYSGRFRDVAERIPDALLESRDREDYFSQTLLRTGYSTIPLLCQDQPDRVAVESSEVMPRWAEFSYSNAHRFECIGLTQAELYAGRGAAAWERLNTAWPKMRKSGQFLSRMIRVEYLQLRGRAALAAITGGPNDRKYLRSARQDAARIRKETSAWAAAMSLLLESGIRQAEGNPTAAQSALLSAASACDRQGMPLFAAAARRQSGRLQGGQAGEQLIATSDELLREQGVLRPERMAAMLVPMPGDNA